VAPGTEAVLENLGVDRPGPPLFAIDPNPPAGCVLTQCRGQTLTGRVAEGRSKPRRALTIEHVEGDDVSGEGIPGQDPPIEEAIEKVVGGTIGSRALLTRLGRSLDHRRLV